MIIFLNWDTNETFYIVSKMVFCCLCQLHHRVSFATRVSYLELTFRAAGYICVYVNVNLDHLEDMKTWEFMLLPKHALPINI